jgi:hypothetical protein
VIASASGSQLASYVWGAANVIFIVGAQKLVPTLEAARERILEHSLKLEDARAFVAYGQNSYVGKLLEIHQELPGRTSPRSRSGASERLPARLRCDCAGRRAGVQVTTSASRRVEQPAGTPGDDRLAAAWARHASAGRTECCLAGGDRGPKEHGRRF